MVNDMNDLTKKPDMGQLCICECPGWCSLGYQIAEWDGKQFIYPEQPNDDFNELVIGWMPFDD